MRAEFYNRDTVQVAKDLLGKILVVISGGVRLSGIISETEAYTEEDPACHAFEGRRTNRTQVMFGPPGRLYVYLIYGMYNCINIVTESEGRGCAVLIRGLIPQDGRSVMTKNRNGLSLVLDGPGKCAMALGVDRTYNRENVTIPGGKVWVEDKGDQPEKIESLKRVGIREGVDLKWRFRIYKNVLT